MNTSTKCNCCCKEDVCAIKDDYIADCKRIKDAIISEATSVSISCKHFAPNSSVRAVLPKEAQHG